MASKRRQRRKSCEGKVRHAGKAGALLAMKRTGDGVKEGLGVYRCKHCQAWHVGHGRGSRFLISGHLSRAVLYHD